MDVETGLWSIVSLRVGIAIPDPGITDPGPFFNFEIPGLSETKSRDFVIRK